MKTDRQESIEVRDPRTLKTDRLPVERVLIELPAGALVALAAGSDGVIPGKVRCGSCGTDIVEHSKFCIGKPCLAKLPDGKLLLVAFGHRDFDERSFREPICLFRSSDGGKTWDAGRVLSELVGREPYLTVLRDGTLLMTVRLLQPDARNEAGYTQSYVHRSDDRGQTWTSTLAEPDKTPPKSATCTSRNVLELRDRSIIFIASADRDAGPDYVWRSTDRGRTWSQEYQAKAPVPEGYPYPFFGEAVLWQARSGKTYCLNRIDPRWFPALPGGAIETGGHDQLDRMIVYSSIDEGRTWQQVRDFGDYGEMYPGILRLQDGRLLLTFTERKLNPPIGVRAILGREEDDGFLFDFEHDRVMLDTKTPHDRPSAGGFGNTVQLDDGTLVSCYSYRDADNRPRSEVARWTLPQEEFPLNP